MSKIYLEYCQSALDIFAAQYGASKRFNHAVSIGSIREQIIRDFLSEHLPRVVSVVSGQIFDTNDQYSTQQDVILKLNNVPRLPFASGVDMVFSEGVVATIEIKSTLSGPVLKSVGEGIASVRRLHQNTWGAVSQMKAHSWPTGKILSGVICYGGSGFAVFESVVNSLEDEAKPDFVLDLSSGILIRNNGELMPKDGDNAYRVFPDRAFGFAFFLTFLTEIVGSMETRGVNWRAYLDR